MVSNKKYKLHQIVDQERGISYGIVQPGNHVPEGVAIIKINNLTNGSLDLKNLQFVSKEIDENYSRTRLRGGELLVSLVGSIGEVFHVPEEMKGMNVVRALAVLPIIEEFTPKWIMYWLKSPDAQNILKNIATTSVQATINLKELREIEITLPPKSERECIVSILSALDEKIELNLKMNKTLEEMAMTLYKHWFVDFGPFRDGEFVSSELGEIPKGWEVKSVYSIANFINGAAFKSKDFVGDSKYGLPVIKIAEIKQGITSQTQFSNKELESKYIIESNDILFPWSGNPHTSIGIHLWDKGKALLNQHVFVVRVENPETKCFVFYTLKNLLPTFINLATHKQTTGLGHITLANLKELMISIPDRVALGAFDNAVRPILDLIYSNQIEIQTLNVLRDTLLPKLISGEVRVKEAAKSLAEVL